MTNYTCIARVLPGVKNKNICCAEIYAHISRNTINKQHFESAKPCQALEKFLDPNPDLDCPQNLMNCSRPIHSKVFVRICLYVFELSCYQKDKQSNKTTNKQTNKQTNQSKNVSSLVEVKMVQHNRHNS